ncbi:MAG: N-acetylmuramoyl-L-alanine amidase [Planctomycetota bacterium]
MISSYRFLIPSVLFVTFLTGCPSRPVAPPERPAADMVAASSLAKQLGLQVARANGGSHMLVLTGDRGTVVFNPRLRGVLVCGKVLFPGHRVVIANGRVSVPAGFVPACRELLEPAGPKERPAKPPAKHYGRFHVVIDPGHGGHDPGAIGVRGGYEKTVNLLTSQLIAARLRAKGVRVTMTRTSDVFIPLNERAEIGNRTGADAFVSIHADSNENSSRHGFTLFVCHTKPSYSDSARASKIFRECSLELGSCRALLEQNRGRSLRLASLIRVQMGPATGAPDHGTRPGALRVLERSACPAVLVELGFMSNPSENLRLMKAEYQEHLAAAVADGIIRFLDD